MRGAGVLTASSHPRLTISPSNRTEAFLGGRSDEATPSPMTFVASLLVENDPYSDIKSFSQLLGSGLLSPTPQNMGTRDANAKSNEIGHDNTNGHNTARYKSLVPARIPVSYSSMTSFTIPPGVSPAMLLESPILFNAGQVERSPTTGSVLPPLSASETGSKGTGRVVEQNDGFMFQPNPYQTVKTELPPLSAMDSDVRLDQYPARGSGRAQSEFSNQPSSPTPCSNASPDRISCLSFDAVHQVSQDLTGNEDFSQPSGEALYKTYTPEHNLPVSSETFCDDGHNWKKYGQKQLKGTEQPRSYYKCTHPDCPVKKYIECSLEGVVSKIVYKGEHNHEKPQTVRRASRNSIHSSDRTVRVGNLPFQDRATDVLTSSRRIDSDKASADPSSSSAMVSETCLDGTPEQSFCSQDESGDDQEDEHESKRRRTENMSSHPPRVIVQTVSEIDVLDDGYRWRKYGQKVVKGHTFPRSYYRCTNTHCSVRKHVERSSTDPSSVQTTYEGKHNHSVPPTRGGG